MPELPEIETVKRTLSPHLLGRRIEGVELRRAEVVKHPDAGQFAAALRGAYIQELARRGKYLLIRLQNGATLAVHLRMTGRLLCVEAERPLKAHTHLIFRLDDGRELRFSDTRRFGGLWLLQAGERDDCTGMHKLGVEPFDAVFGAEYLQQRLGRRNISVKQGILDQSVLAGLGNIYADEACFAAALLPQKCCRELSAGEWQALAAAIPPILEAAIANNGTTFSDYLDGEGREGQNMPYLNVYGRGGQPCRNCGAALEKTRVGGRGTVYCPHCQK